MEEEEEVEEVELGGGGKHEETGREFRRQNC